MSTNNIAMSTNQLVIEQPLTNSPDRATSRKAHHFAHLLHASGTTAGGKSPTAGGSGTGVLKADAAPVKGSKTWPQNNASPRL